MSFAEQILGLHAKGLRNYEIAAKLGCAQNTVTWHLSRRGLQSNQNKCISGHPWTEQNTYWTKKGHRSCRTCHRLANRRQNGWQPSADRSRFDHDFFSRAKSTTAWLAGLIAADGCIHDHRRWTLGQSGPHGLELMRSVSELLGHGPGPRTKATSSQTAYTINVSSAKQVSDLENLWRITPKKSLTLRWCHPPEPLICSFLRGYFDGDGHVSANNPPRMAVVGTPEFVTAFRSALPVGGGSLRFHSERTVTFSMSHQKARAALEWLYHDEDLPVSVKAERARGLLATYPRPRK
ncbi:LAGLIDADG family homing endonuclease [Micromonospora sediminicola]|uniref:LAGLIDADG family homing endonuclease n=1 Tax=Micromonospora sediminicola TaxID=946078 RepID=UPI0037B9C40F